MFSQVNNPGTEDQASKLKKIFISQKKNLYKKKNHNNYYNKNNAFLQNTPFIYLITYSFCAACDIEEDEEQHPFRNTFNCIFV